MAAETATEARVVAWVLGEASDFEEADLKRLAERWPEMRLFKSRLESVDALLCEGLAPREKARWRLSPGLRERLVEALDLYSGREVPHARVRSFPSAEGDRGRGELERTEQLPWRRIVVVLIFLGALGAVALRPARPEDGPFEPREVRNLEERRLDSWSGPRGSSGHEGVEDEHLDSAGGIRRRLEELNATMDRFGDEDNAEGAGDSF